MCFFACRRIVRVSELHHPATCDNAGSNKINSFFASSSAGSSSDNDFRYHISEESEEELDDEPVRKRRSRLGLRVCPHLGFEHDYEWFCQEHGERAEEMWNKAEIHVPDDSQPSTGKANHSGNDKVGFCMSVFFYMHSRMCSFASAEHGRGH